MNPDLAITIAAWKTQGVTQAQIDSAWNPAPAPVVPSTPIYYVDGINGNDAHDGKTPDTAFKTPRAISNAVVLLSAGQSFSDGIDFAGKLNAWVGSHDDTNPARITAETLTNWDANSSGCTLANVVLSSASGNGFGGTVHGSGNTLLNVDFGNLSDGFHYVGCDKLTISGGGQVGKVSGRCHYLLDVTNLTWTGDHTKSFGPASSQSPIRFSSPGVRGGTVSGVRVTQVGSTFPIACWAIHAASGVTFNNCESNGGEFSFNTAGAGEADKVSNCTINGLAVTNSKLTLDASIAFNNHFNQPVVTNPSGECISLTCAAIAGNVFDGAKLSSAKHGVMFYDANDTVIKNTVLTAPAVTIPLLDGQHIPVNDGGGNKVVVS